MRRTPRRRRGGGRARVDRPQQGPVVRLGPRVRPARALRAAAAVRPAVRRLARTRRSRLHRLLRSARCSTRPRRPLRDADPRRRHRRSRRRPRRSRRIDARPVRLRGDAAHPADRRAGRPQSTPPFARTAWTLRCRPRPGRRAPRGHRPDRARRASACRSPSGLPGHSLLPGAHVPTPERGLLLRGPVRVATTAAGRRCGVCSSIATSSSTCRCPRCTTSAAIPAEAANLDRRRRPSASVLLEARLRRVRRRRRAHGARKTQASRGAVAGPRLRRRHRPRPSSRYTEEDDPKRLVGVDRQLREAVELYEQRQPAAAMNGAQEAHRRTARRWRSPTRQLAMIQWESRPPAEAVATLRDAIARAATASQSRRGWALTWPRAAT